MRMDRHKPHFKITFEVNRDARDHRTVEVWAATTNMAIKKAEEILSKDKTVFAYGNPSVQRLKT